jgi:Holliday junction resolvase RusA-like endonuclease
MFTVVVRGIPSPQGSKAARPIYRKGPGGQREFTGRVAQQEMAPDLTDWRNKVHLAAEKALADSGAAPLPGPVRVVMVFTVRKPASAPKRKRTWPVKQPDLSKLARAAEDSLTTAGVWLDDAQVVEYVRLAKVYPGEDPDALPVPGVRIRVEPVMGEDNGA